MAARSAGETSGQVSIRVVSSGWSRTIWVKPGAPLAPLFAPGGSEIAVLGLGMWFVRILSGILTTRFLGRYRRWHVHGFPLRSLFVHHENKLLTSVQMSRPHHRYPSSVALVAPHPTTRGPAGFPPLPPALGVRGGSTLHVIRCDANPTGDDSEKHIRSHLDGVGDRISPCETVPSAPDGHRCLRCHSSSVSFTAASCTRHFAASSGLFQTS